jgi:excisionase family DNA binding protein
MEGYMHLAEAAHELGVTRRALLARIARGEMVAERVHEKLWLVSRDEVERQRRIGRRKPGPKPRKGSSEG